MMSRLCGDLVELLDVARTFRPLVLHDQQHAEAELGHQRCRLRAHRRGIEAPLRMRDRSRPDRCPGNIEELALELELRLAECHDDDLRRLCKPAARFAHRNAHALVLDACRTTAKSKQASAAAHDIEQRDPLRDADRIMPGQHDDRSSQCNAASASSEIGQQLQRSGRHRVAGEMMLENHQRVESERLRKIAERKMLGENRGIRSAGLRQHVEGGTNLHGNLQVLRYRPTFDDPRLACLIQIKLCFSLKS